MSDREIVMQHFQDAIEASGNNNQWRFVRLDIIEKALAMLKEQEAVKPMNGLLCGQCGCRIYQDANYCYNCGRKVKRDD